MLLSPADDGLEFVLTLRQLETLTANVCDTPGWKRIGPQLGVLALRRSSFPHSAVPPLISQSAAQTVGTYQFGQRTRVHARLTCQEKHRLVGGGGGEKTNYDDKTEKRVPLF